MRERRSCSHRNRNAYTGDQKNHDGCRGKQAGVCHCCSRENYPLLMK